MKSLTKELDVSEQRRLDVLQEFEGFKAKTKEENNKILIEHEEQMKRLEEDCVTKLVLKEKSINFL